VLFRCAAVLAASSALVTEVPATLRAMLLPENETRGAFVQTKRLPDGKSFESRGVFAIRPGEDFEWRTLEPFESVFRATRERYSYSNEDEYVEKPLKDLRGFSKFAGAASGDFSAFFKAFDAMYKEEAGEFHVLARPKEPRLAKFLSRVDADGRPGDWTLKATFPDRTTIDVKFTVSAPAASEHGEKSGGDDKGEGKQPAPGGRPD